MWWRNDELTSAMIPWISSLEGHSDLCAFVIAQMTSGNKVLATSRRVRALTYHLSKPAWMAPWCHALQSTQATHHDWGPPGTSLSCPWRNIKLVFRPSGEKQIVLTTEWPVSVSMSTSSPQPSSVVSVAGSEDLDMHASWVGGCIIAIRHHVRFGVQ